MKYLLSCSDNPLPGLSSERLLAMHAQAASRRAVGVATGGQGLGHGRNCEPRGVD